jgi:IS30 family transposase
MEQKNKYERISLAERIEIYKLLGQDKNYSFIANELGRHKSSIQREVSRLGRMKYTAMNANFTMVFNSSKRRLNKTKMSQNPELKSYVLQKLELRWSPEQISLTLKRDYPNNPDMNISHEAIYLHVYIHSGPELRLQLRQKRKVRGNTRRGKDKRTTIVDPIRIDERPEEVIGREIPGHWEGDLVMGKESESAIGCLVLK